MGTKGCGVSGSGYRSEQPNGRRPAGWGRGNANGRRAFPTYHIVGHDNGIVLSLLLIVEQGKGERNMDGQHDDDDDDKERRRRHAETMATTRTRGHKRMSTTHKSHLSRPKVIGFRSEGMVRISVAALNKPCGREALQSVSQQRTAGSFLMIVSTFGDGF